MPENSEGTPVFTKLSTAAVSAVVLSAAAVAMVAPASAASAPFGGARTAVHLSHA